MSSNSQLNVSSLFRSLKPESANADSMNGQLSKKAEQRWPLLQSLPPTKWPLTPSLNDSEKQARRIDNSADQNLPLLRKPENLVPSIDLRITEGLDRLFTKTKLIEQATASEPMQTQPSANSSPSTKTNLFNKLSPVPASVFASPTPAVSEPMPIPVAEKTEFKSLFAQANTKEIAATEVKPRPGSIQTILARIESTKRQELLKTQVPNNASDSNIKPPGFFARLGKR
jgi:hypothetical protein